jgi:hypothetical protein
VLPVPSRPTTRWAAHGGGLTTKLHLGCEQGQKPLSVIVTAGQRGDSPQFVPVLRGIRVARLYGGRPRTRPDRVLADQAYTSKAYTSMANRAYLRQRGIKATIPSKADQDAHRRAKGSKGGRPPTFDPRSTDSATPSSAASTGSNATAVWPPAMTNLPSATKPPCTSQQSANGYPA